ncbi:hypothetical protein D3C85_1047290 [compost metagenome]
MHTFAIHIVHPATESIPYDLYGQARIFFRVVITPCCDVREGRAGHRVGDLFRPNAEKGLHMRFLIARGRFAIANLTTQHGDDAPKVLRHEFRATVEDVAYCDAAVSIIAG